MDGGVMEKLENNIIQKKINGLDSLPEGYEPALGNKWELIEASLEGKKKKRPVFYWSAAAAVLVTLGLWWMNAKTTQPVNEVHEISGNVVQEPKALVNVPEPEVVSATQPAAVEKPRKRVARPERKEEMIMVADNGENKQEQQPQVEEKPRPQESIVVAARRSKPKMVELDFNDSLSAQTWMVAAGSNKIKLKVGIGSVAKSNKANTNAGSLLKLQTTF